MSEALDDADLYDLAERVGARLLVRQASVAVAESCTGGLIAKCLTDVAGSSRWFERGLVTYSNRAKQELLGVPADVIAQAGAVSSQVVLTMAGGLLARTSVDWTVAVSGIAGPDGGTADKPVGTVWIGWAGRTAAPGASRFHFAGDRDAVRRASAAEALLGLLALLETDPVHR